MVDPFTILYMAVVLAVGGWALWRIRRALRSQERSRRVALAGRPEEDFEPIHTSSPESRPSLVVKERGFRSLEARFTVHRRLLFPLVVGVQFVLLALPFLSAIPATLLSVVVAVLTVAVGVAARPALENAFAGLMMSFSNVIRLGDTIRIDDWYGTVEDISATHTTIRIWDWRRYVVPNSQIIQQKIVNYSLFDQHIWAHVEFWVAWETDIGLVRKLAAEAAEASPYFEPAEPAAVWIMGTEKEAVSCWVAAWARNAADAWMLAEDVRGRLVESFRRHGVATHGYRTVLRAEPIPAVGEAEAQATPFAEPPDPGEPTASPRAA